jgi:peptidyl-prolyl cis-trans isomerase B (cyclophilin B)
VILPLIASLCAALASPRTGAGIPGQDVPPRVHWDVARSYAEGGTLVAKIEIQAADKPAKLDAWMLEPAAFAVNGKPLSERKGGQIQLAPKSKLTLEIDLGQLIAAAPAFDKKNFKLSYGPESIETEEIEVSYMQSAQKGLDFMKMPVEELANYHVTLKTNQGDIELEFWPDVAPNHVRNFLDLASSGFYDKTTFHRVIPGFMIQGGDPQGTGTGNGPRMLKAEFNDRKHEPGVLSMARSQSPDSASCQFFIVHKKSTHLDGQYTAFGKTIKGQDVVDKIAGAKRGANDKPNEPQVIEKATVVKAAR